jgi:hypothetical protein
VKIFISWSGPLSRRVAEALHDWLPYVLQAVQPYVSSEDIHKGARWGVDISHELKASKYGIICVTADNINAPWLNFEAGALSNKFKESHVSPFLLGVGEDEFSGPLKQFQATVYEYNDMLRLVKSINAASRPCMEQARVEASFKKWWPDLQALLDPLRDAPRGESVLDAPGRNIEDSLTEILHILSDLQSRLAATDSDASHAAPLPTLRSEHDTTRPIVTTPATGRQHRLSRNADASDNEPEDTDTVRTSGREQEVIRRLLDARQHARLARNEQGSAQRHLLDALDGMAAALRAAQEGDTSRVGDVLTAAQEIRNDEGRRLLLAQQHESDAEASLDAALRSLLPSGEEAEPHARDDTGYTSPKAVTILRTLNLYASSEKRISALGFIIPHPSELGDATDPGISAGSTNRADSPAIVTTSTDSAALIAA